jgi:hypothetical protein
MRRISVLLAVAATTALAAASTVAHAAAPLHEWITIDETFTWDDCGFVVEQHDVGRLRFVEWFDDSGVRTRRLVLAPGFRITYTNPATGASVSSVNPFVVHRSTNPDGSETIAFTGLAFALRGGGQVFVDSGRDVIVFAAGNVELVSSVGPTADLCEALSATIG